MIFSCVPCGSQIIHELLDLRQVLFQGLGGGRMVRLRDTELHFLRRNWDLGIILLKYYLVRIIVVTINKILYIIEKLAHPHKPILNGHDIHSLLITYKIVLDVVDVGLHLVTGLLEKHWPMFQLFIGLAINFECLVVLTSALPTPTYRCTLALAWTIP